MENKNNKITKELENFVKFKHKDLLNKYNFKENKELTYPMTLKLMEEIGELSEAILHTNSLQRKSKLKNKKINLGHEMADVILVTLLLAENLKIDINKALTEKIEQIKKR